MQRWTQRAIGCGLLLLSVTTRADVVVTEGSQLNIDVSPVNGRIAIDLLGAIWSLPAEGGPAKKLLAEAHPVRRPRWSPSGSRILFASETPDGSRLRLLDLEQARVTPLSGVEFHDQDGAWHPDGERIVFASDRNNTGLDLWEHDLATGLEWRITDWPGDETEPAWSASGRHLVYVHHNQQRYALMLRRHGETDQEIAVAAATLSAPAWRPDGSLITFLREEAEGASLQMAILSEPVLIREIAGGESEASGAASWVDRRQMFYPADGEIRSRGFEDRRSRRLHFRAMLDTPAPRAPRQVSRKTLAVSNPPQGRLVIRSSRLFDGVWQGYRANMDVVIAGGRIEAIEPQADRDDATLIDLGDVTIIPGLIDSWSAMPDTLSGGTAILAYGVTSLVAEPDPTIDATLWEGEMQPGPRLLPAVTVTGQADIPDARYFLARMASESGDIAATRAATDAWRAAGVPVAAESRTEAIATGADLVLGAATTASAARQSNAANELTLVSGLADAGNAEVLALLESRQAIALGQHAKRPSRRFGGLPRLPAGAGTVVAGSRQNRLPPGLALHAELRALAAAGMDGEQVLHAAGSNAARLLGLDNQIGTLTPGALADLVLISGDPLATPGDALRIVAVVRNGRFFSLVNLLERARSQVRVE